jgi:hypothetical protein
VNSAAAIKWETFEIRLKGRNVQAPSAVMNGARLIVTGKWLKVAYVHEEDWLEGQVVSDPHSVISRLRQSRGGPDLFTFTQKLPETQPKYEFPFEWDNVAAIPLKSYKDWWENRLPQVTRKNVRRSAKRGVVVRSVPLDDTFIRGVMAIYNETPIRQGKPFTHYGKDFDTIKREISTMAGRYEFFGAYCGDELVGFIKLVYLGPLAGILHIVSLNSQYDKRPSNALIARMVETCAAKGITHILYGKYTYGSQSATPLAEFKHRNGFEQINVPRYYVPLDFKGAIAFRLGLHHGVKGMIPAPVLGLLSRVRARLAQRNHGESGGEKPDGAENAAGEKAAAEG